MWRLIRKGFLSNYKVSPKPNALHQVLPLGSSNISVQLVASSQSSSHFTTWVSKKPIFSRNLRRFSTDSSVETYAKLPWHSDQNVSDIDRIIDDIDIRELFLSGNDEIDEVDVEKLENVWSLLQSSGGAVDGSLIASLEGMGLVLSDKFLVRFLKQLLQKEREKIPIENLIEFFSWCMEKVNVKLETRCGLLLVLCSELKKSNAYALKDLGEKESGLLNTKMLNKLICLFSSLPHTEETVFEVFNKFEEFGVADADTYYYTIQSLSGCSRRVYVSQRMLIAGILPNAEKVGDIIFSLMCGNELRAAYSVYMLAKAKNISPPMHIVNFLIHNLTYVPPMNVLMSLLMDRKEKREHIYLALNMLEGFSGEDIKSRTESFSSVVKALCLIEDNEKAKELLFKMIDAGTPPGEEIFSVMIGCYVLRGAMEEAHKIFDEAIKIYTWRNITPDIYQTLIRGYCELDQFDLAENFLRIMNDHGVEISEYNKFIQSLRLECRKGDQKKCNRVD